ncbi:hypothetical protein LTR78_010348 [Recurvomyces mirabilis]|uniref:MYND-type domain-containing protein n=1 Tax=Recurvomyces mirabilis TaxID=574656 RepID=A0AAE0WI17_9PEZI|nr:hypothetical protein LTR78_010348 [Recurvomyces mirabilis]
MLIQRVAYASTAADHDYDIVDDFNHKFGIDHLEEKLIKHATNDPAVKAQFTRGDGHGDPDLSKSIFLSIYAGLCSGEAAVDHVRAHLDSGKLEEMLKKVEASPEKSSRDYEAYHRKGYQCVLLCACAMTLGCTLPDAVITKLKATYNKVGLMTAPKKDDLHADAITQMKKALWGPEGYVDGEPYDFDSADLNDMMHMAPLMGGAGGLINVAEPGNPLSSFFLNNPSSFPPRASKQSHDNTTEYGSDFCDGCGSRPGTDCMALMACAKCKAQKYCSQECQKKHWKKHKVSCKASTS